MSTFHHQKRFSVSSMASAFEVIKEASPEKAASPGIANQTTRYRNTLSTASLLSSGVPYTTNYNPSRAYPRPRLVLPLISRSRRGSLPSAHNSSPLETGVHGSSYALGLYSSPTAAQSYITASVSTNDLSQSSRYFCRMESRDSVVESEDMTLQISSRIVGQSSTNFHGRPHGSAVSYSNTPPVSQHIGVQKTSRPQVFIPQTRIPTPVSPSPTHTQRRHVTTPILPSQLTRKENIPLQIHRLRGQISPTAQVRPTVLTKSKTMGMLEGLTTSFSRSKISLSGRKSTISVQSTNGFGAASYATVPWDTISRVPIDSNAYWSGRFMGKMTKFQDEELQLNLKRISLSYRSSRNVESTDEYEQMLTDGDLRVLRVFRDLNELCITSHAKKSLWEWQLLYARNKKNEKLLPEGGKLETPKSTWVSRMGKAIKEESKDLGKRTSMAFGRRKGASTSASTSNSKKT